MNKKFISIIMPVYNAEEYLGEAIESILNQTFPYFELLIINDNSSDNSLNIAYYYKRKDNRISIISYDKKLGISTALNKGLHIAQYDLIARADADDRLHPERLERQHTFMEEHPEITLCGSWAKEYETGNIWKCPISDKNIRIHMLFQCPIIHPTVIFRKADILSECGYDSTFTTAQDYNLWARLSKNKNVIFANIPEVLLFYRIHPQKNRKHYQNDQNKLSDLIRLDVLKNIGLYPNKNEFICHKIISGTQNKYTFHDIPQVYLWVKKLIYANSITKFYNHDMFTKELLLRYLRFIYNLSGLSKFKTIMKNFS